MSKNQILRMSAADYHADKSRISKHGLDLIHRAPMLYEHERHALPREQTPAMRIGELVHLATLEPQEFAREVVALPADLDRRTKAGKELYADLASKHRHLATAEEHDTILGIAESAREAAGCLLQNAYIEETVHWERAGVACKSRIDGRRGKTVFDLKTTADATQFDREAFRYRYHVQAAFYLDAIRSCGMDAEEFVFIVVEKTAPYMATVFWTDPAVIDAGRIEYMADLKRYSDCLESGSWPGLPDQQVLTLPEWWKGGLK